MDLHTEVRVLRIIQTAFASEYMRLAGAAYDGPKAALDAVEDSAKDICEQLEADPAVLREVVGCFDQIRLQSPQWFVP